MLALAKLNQSALARGQLALEGNVLAGPWRWVKHRRHLRLDAAGKHAVEGVVVLLRDRVVLVIVAAGTGNGQAEQAARHRIDSVIEDVVLVVHETPAQGQKAQRRLDTSL